MKKFGQFILDYAFIIFMILLFIAVSYYHFYCNFIEPNLIKQEVTVMDRGEQLRQYTQWEMVYRISYDGVQSKEKNPYDITQSVYVVETTLGDEFDYDYGTEDVITKLKCERYAEYEKNRATYIAEKEAEELAKEKREQAEEDALDRLNKSCN